MQKSLKKQPGPNVAVLEEIEESQVPAVKSDMSSASSLSKRSVISSMLIRLPPSYRSGISNT